MSEQWRINTDKDTFLALYFVSMSHFYCFPLPSLRLRYAGTLAVDNPMQKRAARTSHPV